MLDKLLDIGILLVLALVCVITAKFLTSRKTEILFEISKLVQLAESKIKGSGLGDTKKREVINQLQMQGIKVTAWVGKAIDAAVTYLNKTGGWLKDIAGSEVTDITTGATAAITGDTHAPD